MMSRTGSFFSALVLGVALLASVTQGASKNFVPDTVFSGSSLNGWSPIGKARWRAENGEIVGSADAGAGGWLLSDKPYQDVAVFASFRCAAGCQTGVLLRAEKTSDGGLKGILVSLNEGDLATYRVTLDAQGIEKSKERLRSPAGGQLRVAPPPPNPAPNAPARAGGPPQIPQMPGGIPSPIPRPTTGLRAGDWNTVELVLDANILRTFLNDAGGVGDAVAEPEYGSFGPFALFAGGTGEVRFKDVSTKDLQPRVARPEQVSTRFRMQAVNEFYYSWGPAVADFNRDGTPDIVAGPYYYLGPDYNAAREIYVGGTIDPGTQYFNGLQYAYDFTGDGWPDVLNAIFQRPAVLYVNPKGESRRWETYTVTDRMSCEFMLLKDVDADGVPEFLFKDSENRFAYAKPDRANPTGLWTKTYISEPGPWANHGMGVGDVNGDGRADFLNAFGWWEQPAAGSASQWAIVGESQRDVDVSPRGVRPLDAVEPGRRRDRRVRRQRRRAERCGHVAAGAWVGTLVVRTEESRRRETVVRRAPDHDGFLHEERRRRDLLATARRHVCRCRRRRTAGLHHRQAVLVAPRHVHRSRSPRGARALRVSHGSEPEGAGRRRVRARVSPQPIRRGLAPVGGRSQQGRQRRDHHVDQTWHVYLLEQLESRETMTCHQPFAICHDF